MPWLLIGVNAIPMYGAALEEGSRTYKVELSDETAMVENFMSRDAGPLEQEQIITPKQTVMKNIMMCFIGCALNRLTKKEGMLKELAQRATITGVS